MGKIFTFILGFVIGGICVFGGQKYHVVVANDGTYLIPKMNATFDDAYVDVRDFTPADWQQHPALAAAIIRDGKSQILQGTAIDSLGVGAERVLQALRGQ